MYPQVFHRTVETANEAENRQGWGAVLFVFDMRRFTLFLGLSAWMTMATLASAADKAAADKKATKAEAKPAAPAKSEDGVKRDPKGVKGISPYMEAINKGDRAHVARDFDGAIAAYRDAIQTDPQNALAHYRVGATQLAKGDQKEAEAAFVNGLRFASKDATLKAKLLFALADLRERQKNNDEAIARWKEYGQASEAEKEAVSYPATASERIARNEAWKKNQTEAAEVKTRIDKRLKEAEAAARKSASDPKNK